MRRLIRCDTRPKPNMTKEVHGALLGSRRVHGAPCVGNNLACSRPWVVGDERKKGARERLNEGGLSPPWLIFLSFSLRGGQTKHETAVEIEPNQPCFSIAIPNTELSSSLSFMFEERNTSLVQTQNGSSIYKYTRKVRQTIKHSTTEIIVLKKECACLQSTEAWYIKKSRTPRLLAYVKWTFYSK